MVKAKRAKIRNCSRYRVCGAVTETSPMWLCMSYTLIVQFLIIGW